MGHGKVKIGQAAFSASQVGTLYGCGWSTMLSMYNKYKGIDAVLQEPSKEAQESMEFGSFFEDAVARYFASKMGFKIKKCGETAYWKDDMPYFICHPDRLVVGKDQQGRKVALEIKCVSPFSEGWGETGTTDIPDVYYFQVQSYFACGVPCDVVYVVCMKGNRISSYEILPDDEVIADIRYRVAKAKADFDADIIPNPENYDEAKAFYGRRANLEADGIGANDEVLGLYDRLIKIHYDQDDLKKKEEEIKQTLMESLGEAPAYVTTEGNKLKKICYWTTSTRKVLDTERLEAEHPEIRLADYTSQEPSRRFNVSYPRTKKEA